MKRVLKDRNSGVCKKTRLFTFGARGFVQVLLAVWLLATAVVPLSSRSGSHGRASPAIGNVRTLQNAYTRWKAGLTRPGSDQKLVLPLQYSKGISTKFTLASGWATLDLNDGALSVEVSGLPDTETHDVWLIDNQPGPGQSVRVESSDRMIRVGELVHSGVVATLQTRLNAADLEGFKLDLVIITLSGKSPVDASLLSGSPSLFQRMFYNEERGFMAGPSRLVRRATAESRQLDDEAGLARLVPAPAFVGQFATLEELVAEGENLFVNETFGGNGRTCATCHPAANNFTLDPAFIATRPANDPLFVSENIPALAQLEDSTKLRNFALINVNNDGFSQPGVFRSVPHTLAQSTSIASNATQPPLHATGWSGDGAPGTGTLRDFPIGAVIQHAPLTLNRVAGVDFRLPTDAELDAMEAFTLSLGRSKDFDFESMQMLDSQAEAGRLLFLAGDSNGGQQRAGKCNLCHRNGGALSSLNPGVNDNFNTGVEDSANPAGTLPRDGGRGSCSQGSIAPCGDGTFNTPPLIEAADTGAFFHNNQSTTLRDAIQFYSTVAFANSPAGQLLASLDSGRVVVDIANGGGAQLEAFLTVLNSLENIRSTIAYQETARSATFSSAQLPLTLALAEIDDALQVLAGERLHPDAQAILQSARTRTESAKTIQDDVQRNSTLNQAIDEERTASGLMVAISTSLESIAAEDGRIREISETTNTGGLVFPTATVMFVGDDQADRQSKAILSFDTSAIPSFIPIRAATLELTYSGINGLDPFATLGSLMVDVKNGTFGSATLEPSDFEAPASAVGVATIGKPSAPGTTFTVNLSGAIAQINPAGRTQFRLAFSLDDNDNSGTDSAGFFSSDFSDSLRRPKLHLTVGGNGSTPQNQPPSFNSDPISKPSAQANQAYSASIATDASDPDPSDVLTFSKVSGPAWLTVASSGALSGTPSNLEVGANSWTVQVSDGHGGTDQAVLNITVEAQTTGPTTQTFESIAAEDGRIRETSEDSNVGGVISASVATLIAGDDLLDRQFVFIVSFDTSSIPDTATLTAATLELTSAGATGQDPFASLGPLLVDAKNGTFGSAALEPGDFEAPASAVAVATVNNQGGAGTIFSVNLASGLAQINKTGRTQFRLRFSLDDNDNSSNDVVAFFSSDSPSSSAHPKLIVTFQ